MELPKAWLEKGPGGKGSEERRKNKKKATTLSLTIALQKKKEEKRVGKKRKHTKALVPTPSPHSSSKAAADDERISRRRRPRRRGRRRRLGAARPDLHLREAVGGNVGDDDIAAALSEAGGTSTRPWRAWWTVSGTCLYLLSMERGRMGKRITERMGRDGTPMRRLQSMCAALLDAPALTLFFLSFLYKTKHKKTDHVSGGYQEEKAVRARRRERE